ncbi:hypothetical protein [Kitasatospora sp. NPDC094011]|uniref:hypothetical protein n=1 Tax=Kitasatospora sp. NPDC094011 TaxID=3364090 RepID=UPI00382D4188
MHTINHTHETVYPHPTHTIWHHLINQLNNTGTWQHPKNTFQPGPTPPQEVTGTTLTTVHTNGPGKPGPKIHFTSTTTHTTPTSPTSPTDDQYHYTATHSGHFTGTTTITLTPLDNNTRTRLSYTFTATPQGWTKLLPTAKIRANHTTATIANHDVLQRILSKLDQ